MFIMSNAYVIPNCTIKYSRQIIVLHTEINIFNPSFTVDCVSTVYLKITP